MLVSGVSLVCAAFTVCGLLQLLSSIFVSFLNMQAAKSKGNAFLSAKNYADAVNSYSGAAVMHAKPFLLRDVPRERESAFAHEREREREGERERYMCHDQEAVRKKREQDVYVHM